MPNSARTALGLLTLALLAGCASTPSTDPTPGASISDMQPSLVVTSTDFVAGGKLDARHSANAWGQCFGDNLNPQLSWEGAPDGTVTFAISMRDTSAGNYSHWVHANIPVDVTSVGTGESGSLPGTTGRSASATIGYFGPCPPGPDHSYEFVVWALDSELDLNANFSFLDFFEASLDHILAQGSIIGVYSPTE